MDRKHVILQIILISAIVIMGGSELTDFSPLGSETNTDSAIKDNNSPNTDPYDSEISESDVVALPDITLSEEGFNAQRIENVEGAEIEITNNDNQTHTVSIDGMNIEREISPSETTTIEAVAGTYSLKSDKLEESVTLDINLNRSSE